MAAGDDVWVRENLLGRFNFKLFNRPNTQGRSKRKKKKRKLVSLAYRMRNWGSHPAPLYFSVSSTLATFYHFAYSIHTICHDAKCVRHFKGLYLYRKKRKRALGTQPRKLYNRWTPEVYSILSGTDSTQPSVVVHWTTHSHRETKQKQQEMPSGSGASELQTLDNSVGEVFVVVGRVCVVRNVHIHLNVGWFHISLSLSRFVSNDKVFSFWIPKKHSQSEPNNVVLHTKSEGCKHVEGCCWFFMCLRGALNHTYSPQRRTMFFWCFGSTALCAFAEWGGKR